MFEFVAARESLTVEPNRLERSVARIISAREIIEQRLSEYSITSITSTGQDEQTLIRRECVSGIVDLVQHSADFFTVSFDTLVAKIRKNMKLDRSRNGGVYRLCLEAADSLKDLALLRQEKNKPMFEKAIMIATQSAGEWQYQLGRLDTY